MKWVSIVGNCGLCLGSPGCRTGNSCREILLGRRIPCNCCAVQSCYTHCSFWKGCSLAQRNWSRIVSGSRSRVQSTARTHGLIDNKPFATARIALTPEIQLVFVTYRPGNGRKEFCVTIRMIGLAANPGPLFIRVNPDAAVFTPYFNKICDWNSRLFCLHQYLRYLRRK